MGSGFPDIRGDNLTGYTWPITPLQSLSDIHNEKAKNEYTDQYWQTRNNQYSFPIHAASFDREQEE
jgi:hypothetical protein